jgi:hypothetical protein
MALLKHLVILAILWVTPSFKKKIVSPKKAFEASRLTISYFFCFFSIYLDMDLKQVIDFRLPECILIKCSWSRIHSATQASSHTHNFESYLFNF